MQAAHLIINRKSGRLSYDTRLFLKLHHLSTRSDEFQLWLKAKHDPNKVVWPISVRFGTRTWQLGAELHDTRNKRDVTMGQR